MTKRIFRISMLLLVCGMMAAFTGCKKDDDSSSSGSGGGGSSQSNHVTYDGVDYQLDMGEAEHDGADDDGIYSFGILLAWIGEEEDEYGEPAEYNDLEIEIYNSSDVITGTYTFSDSGMAKTFETCDFDSRKNGTWIDAEATSGTVKISKSGNVYEITIDCKDINNKSLTGYFKGALVEY